MHIIRYTLYAVLYIYLYIYMVCALHSNKMTGGNTVCLFMPIPLIQIYGEVNKCVIQFSFQSKRINRYKIDFLYEENEA